MNNENNNKRILILTEAGHKTGMGHLVRMRSLMAQLVEDGFKVELVFQIEKEFENIKSMEMESIANWINNIDVIKKIVRLEDVVIVDSYKVDAIYFEELGKICSKIIVIDDNNRIEYKNTVVINPNYYGNLLNYSEGNNNDYYLGKDYLLIRPEFRKEIRIIREKVESVLITLGGTDVNNITQKIIKYCHTLDKNVQLEVVITSQFHNIEEIKNSISNCDEIYQDIDAFQMNALMNSVDFAIASAGGTSNELIKTACPSILIKVADNQNLNIKYLEPLKYFETFTESSLNKIERMFSKEKRQELFNNLLVLESKLTAKDVVEQIRNKY